MKRSAQMTAKILYDDFISRSGIPDKILQDRGGEFENIIFECLNQHFGIHNCRTTPYHPVGNRQCKMMNATIFGMLHTLEKSQKSK